MELLIGCLVVAAIVRHVPGAIQDLVVAWRASKAGEWDWLNQEMARRDANTLRRAERRAALTAKLSRRRDPNPDRRPGLGDIVGDLYHGMCEDALEKRKARRRERGTQPTATDQRVDERLDKKTKPAAPETVERRHCPDCGQQLTRTGQGWWHQDGPTCPATGQQYRPQPTPRQPARPGRTRGQADTRPQATLEVVHRCAGTYCTGCDECKHLTHAWSCRRCGAVSSRRFATKAEAHADSAAHPCVDPNPTRPDGDDRPTPQPDQNGSSSPNPNGDKPMSAPVAEDVQTNEAARRAFDQIAAGARKLADAARMAEEARAQIAAAAGGAADGMSAIRFDAGATAAANEVVDAVGNETLSRWSEVADAALGAADAGKASLEKYRDGEDVVASNNVDGRTLEPSQS